MTHGVRPIAWTGTVLTCLVILQALAPFGRSGESELSGGPQVSEEGIELLVGFPDVEGQLVERRERFDAHGTGDGVEVGLGAGPTTPMLSPRHTPTLRLGARVPG